MESDQLQPAREQNINQIVSFIESGAKPQGTPGKLGVELEHTIVNDDFTPVSYEGEHGVAWLLSQLSGQFAEEIRDAEGDLLGLAAPGKTVTLEPASQFELSAGPYTEIGEIRYEFEGFQRDIAHLLTPVHERILAVGYHPSAKALDLELIPKIRYEYMNNHFEKIGPWGQRMMRGSASTQVSIDYYSEEDCVRKMRVAYALSPLFALITDNAPTFEGAPSPHRMMRTEIWRECDPTRCGVTPDVFDEGFGWRAYAEKILDTPAILVPDGDGWRATEQTFGEVYANEPMTPKDVEHAVSMLFNDVRLKTYVEIRPADAMPIPFVAAYAALVKGLFYNEDNLNELADELSAVTAQDVDDAKLALMRDGYDATVCGKNAGTWADELFERAQNGLAFNERNYLSALHALVQRRTTLADMGAHRA